MRRCRLRPSLLELFERFPEALWLGIRERVLHGFAIAAEIDRIHDCQRTARAPEKPQAESKQGGGAKIAHRILSFYTATVKLSSVRVTAW